MPRTIRQRKQDTLNLRVDPELKADFVAATESENKPVAEVLRELMRSYVQRARRRKFAAEARRQSRLVADSADEAEVMNWIRDVSGHD
ncbi:MAG: antitoxin MazE-like protein [Candidatus Korobacteraceae bacterium]